MAQLELDKFSLFFDSAPIGFFILDKKNCIAQVNLTGASMIGTKRDSLIRTPFHLCINSKDKNIFYKNRREVLQTSSRRQCNLRMVRKRKGEFFAELIIDPVTSSKGQISHCCVTVIDISALKYDREQLKQSEEKYRRLFNTMTEGFALHEIICDKKGRPCDYRFLDVNRAFETFTGLKAKNIVGKTVREVIPKVEQLWIEEYGKVALTGKSRNFDGFSLPLGKYYEVFAYSPAPMQFAVVFMDITERKQAEDEINNLARFPRENPFPVLRIKNDGTILYSNTPGNELLNEWKREVGQQVPNNWINPVLNSIRYGRQITEQIKCGQNIFSIVITPVPDAGYVNLYGRDITVQEQIKEELRKARDELDVKVHQRTTELARTIAILKKEIKERIAAETKLRERTKVLDAFFAYTITPLVILDREFNFIRVNKAYADSCQKEIHEFEGHNHFEFYPHEENEKIFKQVVITKQPFQAFAKPFVYPDHPELGFTYWDWTLVPILDKYERVEFLVFSLRDVTGRKQAELAVIESEEKYRSLVEFSPESVCVLVEEKIVFVNTSAKKLLKAEKNEEVIGKSLWDFIHPDSSEIMQRDLKFLHEKNRRILPREVKIVLLDGSLVEIETSATSVIHQGKEGVLIMFHDITERKKAEDEIRRNQLELRAMSARIQLAEEQERRRIAQDLHDSVGQILAFSGRELKHLQKSVSGAAAKTIEEITSQLDLAVTQTRTLSFDLSPSILYDLGFEVAIEDLVDRTSRARGIRCSFKNCIEPKPLTDEVKVLLYRSVRELLINAVKHAQASLVKVSLLRSNSDIYITVEDDGCGFDVSILNTSSTGRKGFGIFNIRERLNHIGGKLNIESAEGRGTKAVLTAPLDVEKEKKSGS